MRIALLLLSLVAASCIEPTNREVEPPRPDAEPDVRVYLRSLGEWKSLKITGKGDVYVYPKDRKSPVWGKRYEELNVVRTSTGCRIEGITGDTPTVRLKPRKGIIHVGGKSYSGELIVEDGKVINVVPMENYVLGVLRGEIPLPDIPLAAAKAQAIAVRSYTLHYVDKKDPLFDVDDTTLFQVYAGLKYAPDDKTLREGVQKSRGRVMFYENEPVKAYYHSTCGGHTTDVPTGLDREGTGCMPGVPCEYCSHSKYYRWKSSHTEATVLKAVQLDGRLQSVRVTETGPGGRAKEVEVITTTGKRRMSASVFRLRVGPSTIRSTRWSQAVGGPDGLVLAGSGWGHGVGMCQMGAIGRARKGQGGDAICRSYYPGVEIRIIY